MHKSILIILLTFVYAQPEIEWEISVPFTSSNTSVVSAVKTSDGNYACLNTSSGNNIEISKIDQWGNHLWTSTLGSNHPYDIGVSSIKETFDQGFIIVGKSFYPGTGWNVYIIKTDYMGNMEWSNSIIGDETDEGNDVLQTLDGGYIIAGTTNSYHNYTESEGNNIYLIKINADGEEEWYKVYDGYGQADEAHSINTTTSGGYIIAGQTYHYVPELNAYRWSHYLLKTDSQGDMEWENKYRIGTWHEVAVDATQTLDNGYAFVGTGGLIKTDSLGNLEWHNSLWDGSYLQSIQIKADGGFIIGGSIGWEENPSGNDMYLAEANESGVEIWSQAYYSYNSASINSIIINDDETITAAGSHSEYGAYLMKTKCLPEEGYCDCEGNILDECGVCNGPGDIYNCNCLSDCSGQCYEEVVNNQGFVNVAEREQCYEYTLFANAYDDFINSEISNGDFLYISNLNGNDFYNLGEGDYRVNGIYDFNSFAKVYVTKNIHVTNAQILEESGYTDCFDLFSSLGPHYELTYQSNITIMNVPTGYDYCGICNGNNSSCSDDCGGPNGTGYYDNCGICDDNPDNDCVQDCLGDWGGIATYDECGICAGNNSTCSDACGIPNGTGYFDNCEFCDDNPDNDCIPDCSISESFCDGFWVTTITGTDDEYQCWGGTAEIDDCGLCAGGNTGIEYNEFLGCDNICFSGIEFDNCGICNGIDDCLNTPPFAIDAEYSLNEDNQITHNLFASDEEYVNEYFYDDGSAEEYYSVESGNYTAVKFSAVSEGQEIIRFKWYQINDGGAFYLKLYNDNDGLPGEEILSQVIAGDLISGWNTYDLSTLGIYISGDYWVGVKGFSSTSPFGLDTDSNLGNSYYSIESSGDWTPIIGNLMIRLLLECAEGCYTLDYSIVDNPNNGAIEILDNTFTYMPNSNFNGYDSFTFIANDGQSDSNVGTISLIVNPVNDAPWLDDIQNSEIESSLTFTQELSAYDVDGDALTFNVSLDGDATTTISGNILTILPNIYAGIIEVAATVTDGVATDSAHFTLTVFTSGCTAPDCCNYNPNANVDDGSCVCIDFSENYCDCDGNVLDQCGVCGGDGTTCETPGDLNGDGTFNIIDIVQLVNTVMDWTYNPVGDMNEDGVNNVVDIVLLVNIVLYENPGGCDVELWGDCYNINNTTSLNLSQNGLTGEIPPEIGSLINLTYLNLYANQLSGEIPAEIGNLTNLTHLDLQMNQLSGQIPYEIGNLINLNILHLNDNYLSGQIPENICDLALDWSGIWNHYYQIPFFDIDGNNLCPPYPNCLYEEVEEQDTSNCP